SPMRLFFFFHVPAPPDLSTFSLHDALPISRLLPPTLAVLHQRLIRRASQQIEQPGRRLGRFHFAGPVTVHPGVLHAQHVLRRRRSEEHTSELQSRGHLVCRLLLEEKKNYVA